MALEHAILVSLAERAGTGYDLARRFDNSIGYFWTATHQQVYKVLARMQADGWVSVTVVEQDGRLDKKVYEVTRTGRDELARWIAAPAAPEVTRSDLAVKLRGAADGDVGAVLAEVRRHRALHAERLDVYLASEKHEFPDPRRLRGRALHQWLVLRGGIGLEQTAIAWFDDVISALDPPSRKGTT
jgi:DNA-binding PadR family transcriptional regulator